MPITLHRGVQRRSLLLVPRWTGGSVGDRRWRPTGRPAGRRRLGDAGGEGGAMLSTGLTSVSHGSGGVVASRPVEERPTHPYLARQMSDLGFRRPLRGSNSGCVQRTPSSQSACSTIHSLARRTKWIRDTTVYLGLGHLAVSNPTPALWWIGLEGCG